MIFFVQQLKQENERNPTFPQDNPAHVLPWTNPTLQKVHQGRNSWIPLFPSEILGFLFSHSWPALRQSLLQGKALDFLCTAAQSHPSTWMASNPPFPVGQSSSGLRAGSDMDTGAEKGNPGEAEPPGSIRRVPVPLSSPCRGNRSSGASAASNILQPLLSHREFQCSFTSTSIQKGKLQRDPVGSAPWIHLEHPLPALPKEPRAGSATCAKTPGNWRKTCFPQEKTQQFFVFSKPQRQQC